MKGVEKLELNKVPENVLKSRIIRRILNYSVIYEKGDLTSLSFQELRQIQSLILLPLIIKLNYKNRHR